MKTFVFRLARKDGTTLLGELLNVPVSANNVCSAEITIKNNYPDYYVVGFSESK
jgi:hypothetical protein